jgi:hypothetical protein
MPPTIARFHQPGLSAHAQRPPRSGLVQVPIWEVAWISLSATWPCCRYPGEVIDNWCIRLTPHVTSSVCTFVRVEGTGLNVCMINEPTGHEDLTMKYLHPAPAFSNMTVHNRLTNSQDWLGWTAAKRLPFVIRLSGRCSRPIRISGGLDYA